MNVYFRACVVLASLGLLASSCDSYKDDTPADFPEPDKDLSGEWKIVTVKRNNIDITEALTDDLPDFTLDLNADGTYRVEDGMPFVVETNGQWSIDDPQHPFVLSFTEDGAMGALDVEISYPNVKGKRQLSVTHSPGCDLNKYEYLLERVN